MGTKYIRYLQGATPYGHDLRWMQTIQRADHRAQDLGGNMGIDCGSLELLVPK